MEAGFTPASGALDQDLTTPTSGAPGTFLERLSFGQAHINEIWRDGVDDFLHKLTYEFIISLLYKRLSGTPDAQ